MKLWSRFLNLFRVGAGTAADTELMRVDDYLRMWDRFAEGHNELFPALMTGQQKFESRLALLLGSGDRRAIGRLVFYAVVQVGGSIRFETDLGRAAVQILGSECRVSTGEDGARSYFAGSLFFWWEAHGRRRFEIFRVFDEWMHRDFAREVVIPMYLEARKNG